MATFTPPTYFMPWGPENAAGFGEKWSLWRHYDGIPTGYVVLITSGVATASPGRASVTTDEILAADSGSGDDGRAHFRGGIGYAVTTAEKTILEAAGYTVD